MKCTILESMSCVYRYKLWWVLGGSPTETTDDQDKDDILFGRGDLYAV